MQTPIRIGTRDSKLALWQAYRVQELLMKQGIACTIVPTKSEGDLDLVTPLYAMGVQGVFTKTLDAYLLSNKIDIAVHSMKDVPIQLPEGIVEAAVLKRASHHDVWVPKRQNDMPLLLEGNVTIGTGSIRRKAQWLHRYPQHQVANLRGNLQTRLQKLASEDWAGAIFAAAGLERLDLLPPYAQALEWMLPAPAQGAIMVVARESDSQLLEALSHINDRDTALAVSVERAFLASLMGGCSTPIAALATIKENVLYFKGNVTASDGSESYNVELQKPVAEAANIGAEAANKLIQQDEARISSIIQKKL